MKKNIFGSPTKTSDVLWTYKGQSGNEVVAPFDGIYKTIKDDYFICQYLTNQCTFDVLIGPLKDVLTQCNEGQKIGEAKNDTITLTIKKGNENFNIDDFFNQRGECFTEKKEEKSSESKSKSKNTMNNTSVLSNPYKFAAKISPVGLVGGGLSAFKGLLNKESVDLDNEKRILEEIHRIKKLLK